MHEFLQFTFLSARAACAEAPALAPTPSLPVSAWRELRCPGSRQGSGRASQGQAVPINYFSE